MAAALPAIAIASMVIGTGMGLVSAVGQSNAQHSQADAMRMQSQSQAAMYMYNAAAGKAAADRALYEQNLKSKKILASQRADYSKAGIDITQGSPLEVAADSAAQAEFDALGLKYQGDLALWRGEVGAKNALAGASSGANLLDSAADTTLLTGFGNAGMGVARYVSSLSGKIKVPTLTYGQASEQSWNPNE